MKKKLNSKMKKKLNAKVDHEKVKEVKRMIETLKDFIGKDGNLTSSKNTVEEEVAKSSSSKLTSLPAGPVGTIKIEMSEMDLLNKNWLAQIEQSPFPLVFLRPLSKKLLSKYNIESSESLLNTNAAESFPIEMEAQETKQNKSTNQCKSQKTKKHSSKGTKSSAASLSDDAKDILKSEVMKTSIKDPLDVSVEDVKSDILQEAAYNKCSVQNNQNILEHLSPSVIKMNVEDKVLENKDSVTEEIVVEAKPKNKRNYKKGTKSGKYSKQRKKKDSSASFLSPAALVEVTMEEVMKDPLEISTVEDVMSDDLQEATNNKCSGENNENILEPLSSSEIKMSVEDKVLKTKDSNSEEITAISNLALSEEVVVEAKPKKKRNYKRETKSGKTSKQRKKKDPSAEFLSPASLVEVKMEEEIQTEDQESSDANVVIGPEDIMANCEVSFVEAPSEAVIILEPLSKKVIEEAMKGFYLVEGETDDDSIASFYEEDPPWKPNRRKRKAKDALVSVNKGSSEKINGPEKVKKKRYSIPPWPARVIEENFTMYKCSLCPYKSRKLNHMKNHLVKHSNAKLYKCSQCNYESNKENNLQWHMLRHPGTKAIEMLVPEYKIISEIHDASDVGPHSIIESFAKIYRCSACKYVSDDVSLVDNHLASHPVINCTDINTTENIVDDVENKEAYNKVVEIAPPPMEPTLPDDIKLNPLVGLPKQEEESEEEIHSSPLENFFIMKLNEIGEPKNEIFKTFMCPKCNFKTHLRANLVNHIALHLNDKLHMCPKCHFETNYKFVLYRHINSCVRKVKTEESMENNSENFEKNIDAVDLKDRKLFNEINLSKLRRDLFNSPETDLTKKVLLDQSSPSQPKLFKCFNCPYESRYKFILRKHIDICEVRGGEPTITESNESVVNNLAIDDCFASRFQEPVNMEAFNNITNYSDPPAIDYSYNNVNVPMEEPRPVNFFEDSSCTMCSFQAETREDYVRHLQSHYNFRLHQCLNCDFKTNYNYILTQHMSKCPYREEVIVQPSAPVEAPPQRMYECPYCKFKTHSEERLKAHAIVHLGPDVMNMLPVSQFRCSECNFVTHRKAIFSRHMNNHSNIVESRYVRNVAEQSHALNYVDNTHRYSVDNMSRSYQSPGEPQVENHFSSYLDTPESIGANDEHDGAENLEGHVNYNSHSHMMPNRHDNVFVGIHNM